MRVESTVDASRRTKSPRISIVLLKVPVRKLHGEWEGMTLYLRMRSLADDITSSRRGVSWH
jgi:hypothetical protein